MATQLIDVDKNFKVNTVENDEQYDFYDVRQSPFKIYGLYKPETEDVFKRIPDEVAESVSEGICMLYKNTSGGRIRFKTNSKSVAIKVKVSSMNLMPHMAMCGCSGFDLYSKETDGYRYRGSFLTMWGPDAVERIEKMADTKTLLNSLMKR